ncbi:hypothetical protein [uncultured Microbacterium sp.]|uniref:DUF7657 domain-containing protein n=1 Tax=uncultured Microbacterium sp. TaxID=191216 RepID=UPI0028CFE77F|nr:hypothetical protein [uncultured Microbacterium sp.]
MTAPADSTTAGPSRAARVRSRWGTFVEPREDGLPNRRVLALPLLLLAMLFVGLVALGITGTSTGFVHSLISTGEDADLIAGDPQAIRSDEWFVQTSWTISQVEQGLPLRNETFPGGMDATVQHDLPTTDWSTALRPHLIGFLFLPLDQAMAVKWWLPAFAMMASLFLLTVTLLPRRPISGLLIAAGFFFSPFLQWWFLSITFYPPAWAFLVMAAVVWCLKTRGRVGQWLLAGLLAYLTVALGTGIYVPFIVPAVVVALGFSVGAVLTRTGDDGSVGQRLRRVAPIFIAGAAGALVLGIWAVTRWQTIVGFTSTVYPGERLQPVGSAGLAEVNALFSGIFSVGLERTGGRPFGPNSSEASTFLLPGLFMFVVLIWLIVDRFRTRRGIDWLSITVLASGALMLAFLFIPGWDAIAHLLLLDRTTYGRMRLGFGLLSIVMILLVAVRVKERSEAGLDRIPSWVPLVGTVLAALMVARIVWVVARDYDPAVIVAHVPAIAIAAGALLVVLFVLSVWLFGRGSIAWGAAVLLVVSVVSSVGVNPLYRGVLDLRMTQTVAEIERLNDERPGEWVGINTSVLPTMMLVESGVSSFNGFQSAPSEDMWGEIDPQSKFESNWNRLANVSWVIGSGDPAPRNPAPDQIQMTFDSCNEFAQENVQWILSEVPVDQSCVTLVSTVPQGPTTMRIYEVTTAN